jgi:hypothetical protein
MSIEKFFKHSIFNIQHPFNIHFFNTQLNYFKNPLLMPKQTRLIEYFKIEC